MNGREVFKFATRVMVSSAETVLAECGETVDDIDVYVPHQANIRIIEHATRKLGIPEEKVVVNVDRFGNTSSGSIPLALADAADDGRLKPGKLVLMTGMGAGLTWGSALIEWTQSTMNGATSMTKIAFMFPGQGSFELGHGPRHRRGRARRDGGLRRGQQGLGARPAALCFAGSAEELTQTELQQPALVATSLAINAALRARGIAPDYVVGHSVGEFSALGAAGSIGVREAIALVRERGLAMAAAAKERPGSMAAILGLADEVVEALCRKIHNVWPANYNCPGQLVISGETDAVDECCSEAQHEGARRAVRLRVSGAFHSPLVEHAAERLRPAIDRIDFKVPTAQFVSTVTAKLEDVQRYRSLLVEQLTAPVKFTQAARELVGHGVTTFVEVGPGQRAQRFTEEDRQLREAISVNDLESLNAAVHELG